MFKIFFIYCTAMLIQICAQTCHTVSAKNVKYWLENSKQRFTVKGVEVYQYWVKGHPDEEDIPGFWWVATIDVDDENDYSKTTRVYFKRNGHRFDGKFFNVKRMTAWPHMDGFRNDWDDDDVPVMLSSAGKQMKKSPTEWEDVYEEVRQKKPHKRTETKPEPVHKPYMKDLEVLDQLEEQLKSALCMIKDLRTKIM